MAPYRAVERFKIVNGTCDPVVTDHAVKISIDVVMDNAVDESGVEIVRHPRELLGPLQSRECRLYIRWARTPQRW